MTTKIGNIQEDGHVERQFRADPNTSGLVVSVAGGVIVLTDLVTTIAATDVTVTDDDVTYIYIDSNTFTIVTNVVFPVEDFVMIAEVTAASGVITEVLEWRSRSSGILDIT